MIISPTPRGLRLITQPDHARLASEILSLWRADGLPAHARRADLLFAVAEHDNGWREADAAPYADPESGRPFSFLDLPDPLRIEIWDRGVGRFASGRPYPALLIVEHARELHRDRLADPGWSDFFERLGERRAELLEASAAREDELEADYRWLALADRLSLAACAGRPGRLEQNGSRARWADGELELEPFPLAGATTFRVPCRLIPDRPYRGDADLGVELASARWERLEVRLRSDGWSRSPSPSAAPS